MTRATTKLARHVQHNLVAYLALFVALGGTSYAAISLPRNSVGTRQIRDRAITPAKINRVIAGTVRAWAAVAADGTVLSASQKVSVNAGTAIPGSYDLTWHSRLPSHCVTVGNVALLGSQPTQPSVASGYMSMVNTGTFGRRTVTGLNTFNQSGVPTALGFDVAVIC
jgi:hypothetical protein